MFAILLQLNLAPSTAIITSTWDYIGVLSQLDHLLVFFGGDCC